VLRLGGELTRVAAEGARAEMPGTLVAAVAPGAICLNVDKERVYRLPGS
jgi:hypothetical protein